MVVSLVLLVAVQLRGAVDRLPQSRRQVGLGVVRSDDVDGPMQFGFELGTGVRTYATTVGSYVLLAAGLLRTRASR